MSHEWIIYGSLLNHNDNSVKPVLSGYSIIEKTKVLKTNSSLMKVQSIAECSLGAFCNTFHLHEAIIGLENQFMVFFLSGRLRQVLLYFLQKIYQQLYVVKLMFEHFL